MSLFSSLSKFKYVCVAYLLVTSYLATCACLYLSYGRIHSTGIETLFIMLVILVARYYLYIIRKARNQRFDIVYGILGGILLWTGKQIYDSHGFELTTNHPIYSLLFLGGCVVLICSSLKILEVAYNHERMKPTNSKVLWNITWNTKIFKQSFLLNPAYVVFLLVALVIHVICFLAYYPGIGAYDWPWQTYQALHIWDYNNHWPILHTLIWEVCIYLGRGHEGLTTPLAIYSVFQIACVCATYSYVLYWMDKKGYKKSVVLFSMAYFIMVPVFHIMAINMNMVVLFSCVTAVYMTGVVDLSQNVSATSFIKTLIFGLLSILLRNNMIYVIFIAGIISVLFIRAVWARNNCLQFVIISIIGIIIFKIVYPEIGVYQGTRTTESMSVPCSQMAYVYKKGGLTESERETVLLYVSNVDQYNPRFADPIKGSFNTELYNQDKGAFWRFYLKLAIKNPVSFLSAFFDLNIQYWYPSAVFVDPFNWNPYIETSIKRMEEFPPIERDSKNEHVLSTYNAIASFNNGIMRLPVLYQFFSISFPALSLYIGAYLMVKGRRKSLLWMYIISILLFGTYLLGPCALFRYVFSFFFTAPLYLGGLFEECASETSKSRES